MGIRGELFSTKVSCEGRTYFFNVKENRMGDPFLTIVESKPTETETFERRSIVIFRENMKDFLKAFQSTLAYLEKEGAQAPRALRFEPEDGAPPPRSRAKRAPEGEAGASEPAAKPKRRVVVKRAKGEDKAE